MARLVVKNGHHKIPCCDDIGLYAQNIGHHSKFKT
jgi:hypothetical protein